MRGSIRMREEAAGRRYDVRYWVGRRQRSKMFARRKDAERFLAETVNGLHRGTHREIRPISFGDYAARWLDTMPGLKPSTRRSYRSILERQLVPVFGDSVLSALTADDINRYLVTAEQAGLKVKTRRNVLVLLHKVLEDARASGFTATNPLRDTRAVRRPRALRPEDESDVELLNPEEVNRLFGAMEPSYLPLFLTAVSSGLRLGELLGLQWGDLDAAASVVHVRRTLYQGEYYVPKSKAGRRTVDVGDQLLGALAALRRARFGDTDVLLTAPVFTTPAGGVIDPDNLRHRIWAPAIARAGLRHVVIHSLRHTYASLLIQQGESIKYIQKQLGHASATLTLDTYGHLFPRERRQTASRLEAQLQLDGCVSWHSHGTDGAERSPIRLDEDGQEDEATPDED